MSPQYCWALDSSQRVFDLMREPGRRELQVGLGRAKRLRGAAMEREVMQQHHRAAARSTGSQKRRDLRADRRQPRSQIELGVGVGQVLPTT